VSLRIIAAVVAPNGVNRVTCCYYVIIMLLLCYYYVYVVVKVDISIVLLIL